MAVLQGAAAGKYFCIFDFSDPGYNACLMRMKTSFSESGSTPWHSAACLPEGSTWMHAWMELRLCAALDRCCCRTHTLSRAQD